MACCWRSCGSLSSPLPMGLAVPVERHLPKTQRPLPTGHGGPGLQPAPFTVQPQCWPGWLALALAVPPSDQFLVAAGVGTKHDPDTSRMPSATCIPPVVWPEVYWTVLRGDYIGDRLIDNTRPALSSGTSGPACHLCLRSQAFFGSHIELF